MMEIILYIAVSQDGFIADETGGVAWLDKYNDCPEDYGYPEFYASIDALVFGRITYEQVLTFGPWPYPDKKSYILTSNPLIPVNDSVEIVSTDISTFVEKAKLLGIKRLWLMGGAQLAGAFDKLGLIDEYILTVIPEKLGKGISLPEEIFHDKSLLVDTITYPISGIIQKYYRNT
jgi:dihydrofolate reductase